MTERPIKRKEVISLLTQDDYYRKQRKWPLISYDDITNSISKTRHTNDDLFVIDTRPMPNRSSLSDIINEINISFPFTNELLNKFQNNLVACGGSICKSIIGYERNLCNDDIDFFFYDLDIYQANEMRIKIIEYMVTIWKSKIGTEVIREDWGGYKKTILKDVKFHIQRNEYVTTIHVEELCDFQTNSVVYMYQFIHRIYPDISSIIGGFDLSASAVAYDGDKIYTTPLGAWSIINKSIIIDMGRRSTSYEHRLRKYINYGFRLIFPGIRDTTILEKLIDPYNKRAFFKFEQKIQQLARENDYFTTCDDLSRIFVKRGSNHDTIDELDELAFNKIQKENNILEHLILNINHNDDIYIKQSDANPSIEWYDWNKEERGKCCDRNYYLNKLSDYGTNENFLMSISDYHHNHMFYKHVPAANATRLRLNNLKSVVSMLYIDNHENIKEKLEKEVDNPNLGINDFVIDLYKESVDYEIEIHKKQISVSDTYYHLRPGLIKCFGPFTSEIVGSEDYTGARDLMIENIRKNDKICKENLVGIKWITDNPGRQWTSSINPIFKDPRDWYGKHYNPVLVGIPPEIETCLRLMRLEKTNSYWFMIPKDIFDLLLLYILRAYANHAWKYIMLKNDV